MKLVTNIPFIMWVGTAEKYLKVRGQRSKSYVYKCVISITAEAYISTVLCGGSLVSSCINRTVISEMTKWRRSTLVQTRPELPKNVLWALHVNLTFVPSFRLLHTEIIPRWLTLYVLWRFWLTNRLLLPSLSVVSLYLVGLNTKQTNTPTATQSYADPQNCATTLLAVSKQSVYLRCFYSSANNSRRRANGVWRH